MTGAMQYGICVRYARRRLKLRKHVMKLRAYSNAYVHDSCIVIEITLTLIYINTN